MITIAHYPWHRRYRWGWQTRLVTAWGIVVGRWSIARAWQEGYEQHVRDEKFNRVINPTGPVYESETR